MAALGSVVVAAAVLFAGGGEDFFLVSRTVARDSETTLAATMQVRIRLMGTNLV